MAALGSGKGNFGANCGERRAAGGRGLRARRRAVVPDRRESQGMEWESIKNAFEVDGFPRDIYVFDSAPRIWTVSWRRTRIGDMRLVNRRRYRDAYKTDPAPR